MARDMMASNLISHPRTPLKIDLRADFQVSKVRGPEGLLNKVEAAHITVMDLRHRETSSVESHRGANGNIFQTSGRELNRERHEVIW
eukprot:CAMPEP_0196580288 /NCGR_PEP_ID=MMETSP1081-20130531/28285_1 /TAXON_ID=36882 /ORGANISM="Pyramimonas amylifera, Strain CCMP720" /LENGTH=86 /DNA_ID=CAMNT_0041900121 /DNA_START=629 /DNA_END=886 /DNA_ORIENTATION=+